MGPVIQGQDKKSLQCGNRGRRNEKETDVRHIMKEKSAAYGHLLGRELEVMITSFHFYASVT